MRCRLEAGEALIVADADWLDPVRWPPGSERPEQIRRALRSLRLERAPVGPAIPPIAGSLLLLATVLEQRRFLRRTSKEQMLIGE